MNKDDLIQKAKDLKIYNETLNTVDLLKSAIKTEEDRLEFEGLVASAKDLKIDEETLKGLDTSEKLKAAIKELENSNLPDVKIEFLKSPTGAFNLGYNVGETAIINANMAQELIDAGYAKAIK